MWASKSFRPAPAWAPALLAALVVLAGLVSPGIARAGLLEDDEARRAILEARKSIAELRQRVDAGLSEEQRRASEENAQLRRSVLELSNQIEALRAEVARLRGQDEQLARDMAQMQIRQKDLLQETQGVGERLRQVEPSKVTLDGREFLAQPAEARDFNAALAALRQGEFAQAQAGFADLLTRYPASGYKPSALFWLGNAQYAQRNYKDALTQFRTMVSGFPDDARAPEALLSLANCRIELKEIRGARKTLEDLIKAYPKSEAAGLGKERLAKLK